MPTVSIQTSPLLIIPSALTVYAIPTIGFALIRRRRGEIVGSAEASASPPKKALRHASVSRRPRRISIGVAACAALLIATCFTSTSAQAFALRLAGPFDARAAFGMTNILFYGDVRGRIKEVAKIGDLVPDGGTVVDLGVPAMMPDGRIIIGAEVESDVEIVGTAMPPRWELLSIDPKRPVVARTTEIIPGVATSTGCSPSLNVDPYPVADDQGAILFAAPSRQGGDAVFVAAAGEISCLARVGDLTDKGRRVKTFGFGSVQAAGDRQVVTLAMLEGDRNAVLLISRQGLTEVAVEGEASPQGEVFGRNFGLPAISTSRGAAEVAFTNNSRAGGALFIHRNGTTSKALAVGTATSVGKVGFLSPSRPAVIPDGTLAVLGACERAPVIFVLRPDGHGAAVSAGTASGWGLSDLGNPLITETGAILFGATNSAEREQLYLLKLGRRPSPFRPTEFTTRSKFTAPAPRIFSGTLTTNARGQFAFLGGG